MQVKENKALEVLLQEKVAKEKQKYSDLLGKYQDLQNSLLLGSEIHTGSLQEEIVKERQKYSDLQGKYEELIKSVSLDSVIQTELSKLQVTMEAVTISLGKVEVIKNYWSDKVRYAHLHMTCTKLHSCMSSSLPEWFILNFLCKLKANL